MSKGIKIFLIVGGIFSMLGVCALVIYILITQTIFSNPGGKSITLTPTNATPTIASGTVAPTDCLVATPPSGWNSMDNTSQDYIAYRPSGWYFRLFPPAMETLGIDSSKIPEASEWAGIITMTRLSASNNFESYKSNLEAGYTSAVQVISCRSWTIIEGQTPANELFNAQFVKYAYVVVNGKEFLAGIRSDAANFGGQEGNFDTFVQTINFY